MGLVVFVLLMLWNIPAALSLPEPTQSSSVQVAKEGDYSTGTIVICGGSQYNVDLNQEPTPETTCGNGRIVATDLQVASKNVQAPNEPPELSHPTAGANSNTAPSTDGASSGGSTVKSPLQVAQCFLILLIVSCILISS